MVRKIMHRICACPASQRDARQQSLLLPSAWVSCGPAASIGIQREVTRNDFQRIINQFADAGAGEPGYVLSAFGFSRGASGRSSDGAPPTVIFRTLEQLISHGRQLAAVVDRVAATRWNARMESSSLRSYVSHLRMIAWGCKVFGIDPCRPDILGIRRIAACVNKYSTLAGWLSAWKAALGALGQPWPGDVDPVLRGIRRGTRRLQVPRMPRQRVRRRLLSRLLVCAIQKNNPGWMWWAFLGIIPHSFALRMPSELFAQFPFDKLHQKYEGWEYGPIKSKMRLDWQNVKSFCSCSTDPFLCLCSWHRVWPDFDHSKELGGFSATKWTAGLRTLLSELGVPNALDYHGHVLRLIFSQNGVWQPCSSIVIGSLWGQRFLMSSLMRSKRASLRKALQTSQSLIPNTFFFTTLALELSDDFANAAASNTKNID